MVPVVDISLRLDEDGSESGRASISPELHGGPLRPGWLLVDVSVAPGRRRHGVGGELCRLALELARAAGAETLLTAVAASDESSLAFAARRGFWFAYEMLDCELDVAHFDPEPRAGVVAGARNRGLRFSTLAEATDPEATVREVYDLDRRLSADVPEWSGVMPPLDEYRTRLLAGDRTGVLIARFGERPVGMAVSTAEPDGTGYTEFLGVERQYRGTQVALALKLLTVEWAQRHGLTRLRSNSNAASAGIVALNRKLGYSIRPGAVYLTRSLA